MHFLERLKKIVAPIYSILFFKNNVALILSCFGFHITLSVNLVRIGSAILERGHKCKKLTDKRWTSND